MSEYSVRVQFVRVHCVRVQIVIVYFVRVQSFRFHCVRDLCVGETVYNASQLLLGGGGWE